MEKECKLNPFLNSICFGVNGTFLNTYPGTEVCVYYYIRNNFQEYNSFVHLGVKVFYYIILFHGLFRVELNIMRIMAGSWKIGLNFYQVLSEDKRAGYPQGIGYCVLCDSTFVKTKSPGFKLPLNVCV